MEVRTFYANTIEAAFALAKSEFGPEAMLMQSNRVTPGPDPRGCYEVVFAGEPRAASPGDAPCRREAPEIIRPGHVRQGHSPKPLRASFVPELVRSTRVSRTGMVFGPIDLVRGNTTNQGPSPAASNRREAGVHNRPGAKPPNDLQLNPQVACNPGITRFASECYNVALAGPPGSGKTTTAMKLVLQQALLVGRPCRLIAYEPERTGTAERLRHFSNLLKIPFEALETPAQLAAAIERKTQGLTIIDTPGCARADDRVLAALAFLLASHPDVETQLVLRADRRVADNTAAAHRFSALTPMRFIMTALDETDDYRELASLALAVALPLSFLGTGQRIPDDLEPATNERLAGLIHHGWSRTAAAAA